MPESPKFTGCVLRMEHGGVIVEKRLQLNGTWRENEYMAMFKARELYRDLLYAQAGKPNATEWAALTTSWVECENKASA